MIKVLNHASIIGKTFSLKMLSSMLSRCSAGLTEEQILESLNQGIKSGLVAENLSDRNSLSYMFTHEKIIEALAEKMSMSEIKKLNRIAAEIIEESHVGEDKIYKLAHYYLRGDARRKAYKYNIEAGKLALKHYAFKLAIEYLTNSLNILKEYGIAGIKSMQNRLELSLEITDVNYQLGDYESNLVLLKEIKPIAEKLNEKSSLARVVFLLGRNNSFLGHNNAALDYYKQALPIAEEVGGGKPSCVDLCFHGPGACL